MNKGIFLYTFKRYLDWHHIVFGALFMLMGALVIAGMWSTSYGLAAEMARWLLFGPTVPFIVSLSIVMPQVANSQQRKDGEYLSLLFTRPVSRTGYVITKWVTASVFTFSIVISLALLATAICAFTKYFNNPLAQPLIDVYGLIDGTFNSMSFSALVVLISSAPPRVRVYIGLALASFMTVAMTTVGLSALMSGATLMDASKVVGSGVRFLGSFMAVSFDSYHIINSAESPITTLLIFVSNIVLYLTLASLMMCQREFFYAND